MLGLGANYCLQSRKSANNIETTVERYSNNVRRTHFWKNHQTLLLEKESDQYNPKLYFKSDLIFGPASNSIELTLKHCSADLRRLQARYCTVRCHPNLTPRKYSLLASFKFHDLYIVIESDKNLGLCILERDYYIKRCIEEHLGNPAN